MPAHKRFRILEKASQLLAKHQEEIATVICREAGKAWKYVITSYSIHYTKLYEIEEGVLTSIIGPNGAGKSTLINLFTGFLPVQTGRIFFREREITRLPVHERVRRGICRSSMTSLGIIGSVVGGCLFPASGHRNNFV